MESSLKNMVLTLFIITLLAAGAVGVVYQLTKAPILAAKEAKTKNALTKVLPPFATETHASYPLDGDEVVVYTARNNDSVVGYAIETFTNKGFGGKIKLMVGFLPDGTINKIEVLKHGETPGLGDKIDRSKSDFAAKFDNKNPEKFKLKVKKDGGDVDAITASTISSRAFCDGVERAYKVYQSLEKEVVL